MSDEKQSEVAQKLELLKQRFREKASADIEQLQVTVEQIGNGAGVEGDIASVYQSLHRLAGSAGTFGYTSLGEEARQLELTLKQLAEGSPGRSEAARTVRDAPRLLNAEFLSRVIGLKLLLQQDSAQRDKSTDDSFYRPRVSEITRKSVVQIVDSDASRAAALASDLELHGFQTIVSASPGEAEQQSVAYLSAIVVRATPVIRDNWKLETLGGKAPVICISSRDSFAKRYQLAELGASGFFYDPVDVPVLADYIERLITEREEGESGRVMIIDDDPELLEHYSLVLERGGLEVFRVNDPSKVLMSLSEFRPDIVLMDIQMGRFNGPTLAQMLRFDQEWLGLPIIYLSSEEDKEFQLEAMSQGGDDFLTKPVSDAFLLRAVLVRCERARQLDKLASRDSLTGLLKHSLAKSEDMPAAVGQSMSRLLPCSILITLNR